MERVAVTCRVLLVRAPFSPAIESVRFLLDPCTYVLTMLLVLACDFNRRAQKLRWAYFSIALFLTGYNVVSRVVVAWPAEQVSLFEMVDTSCP